MLIADSCGELILSFILLEVHYHKSDKASAA